MAINDASKADGDQETEGEEAEAMSSSDASS